MSSALNDSGAACGDRPWVIVALGANLGNAVETLGVAAEALASQADGPVLRSPLYRTTPVDCPPGSPPFINAVVAFRPRPGLTPEGLLAFTQQLEREAGRQPKRMVNEARPLDVDLIDWTGESRSTDRLVLPHPRAASRRFVLGPLADVFPRHRLHGVSSTTAELLVQLPEDPLFERLASGQSPEKPWLVDLPQ